MRGLKIVLPILLLVLLAGCAPKKATLKGEAPDAPMVMKEVVHQGPVTLRYDMTGKQLRYSSDSDFVQGMSLPAGTMEMKAYENTTYTVGVAQGGAMDYALTVTVDAKETKIETPQGNIEPDMAAIIGQSFTVEMDRLGVESEIEAGDELDYVIGSATRSAASAFQAFFPDLAEAALDMGDSWDTHEVLDESDSSNDITITLDTVNTLDGFVEIDGMLCARIAMSYTGTLAGQGEEQGTALDIAMDLEGEGHWYFAVEEGICVLQESEGTGGGSLKIQGPMPMEIAVSREFTMEVKLLR